VKSETQLPLGGDSENFGVAITPNPRSIDRSTALTPVYESESALSEPAESPKLPRLPPLAKAMNIELVGQNA